MITERYHDFTQNPDSCQGFQIMGSLTRQSCRTGEHLLSASKGAGASGVENLPLSPGGGGLAAASRPNLKGDIQRLFAAGARSPPPDHP